MKEEEILDRKPEMDFHLDEIGDEHLRECAEYMMDTGGKRIRPIMCMTATEELGGDLESATVFSASLELLHNYTLVHDDIQDGDRYRRGQESVWMKYGRAQAIETGDAIHSLAYRVLLENSNDLGKYFEPLNEALSYADMAVASGQSKDMRFRDQNILTEEKYLEMCRLKTGALFAAALEAAAIVSDLEDERDRMRELGRMLGAAFQVKDDIIDIEGQKGRPRGGDIREGKASLPLIYALQELEGEEESFLEEVLQKDELDDKELERALEMVEDSDALRRAKEKSEELMQDSKELLDRIDSDMEKVREISDFLINRNS